MATGADTNTLASDESFSPEHVNLFREANAYECMAGIVKDPKIRNAWYERAAMCIISVATSLADGNQILKCYLAAAKYASLGNNLDMEAMCWARAGTCASDVRTRMEYFMCADRVYKAAGDYLGAARFRRDLVSCVKLSTGLDEMMRARAVVDTLMPNVTNREENPWSPLIGNDICDIVECVKKHESLGTEFAVPDLVEIYPEVLHFPRYMTINGTGCD